MLLVNKHLMMYQIAYIHCTVWYIRIYTALCFIPNVTSTAFLSRAVNVSQNAEMLSYVVRPFVCPSVCTDILLHILSPENRSRYSAGKGWSRCVWVSSWVRTPCLSRLWPVNELRDCWRTADWADHIRTVPRRRHARALYSSWLDS